MSEEKAKQALVIFFNAMHIWEMKNINKEFNDSDESRAYLNKIFSDHCTKKERKTGRQVSLNFRNPPEYDPANQCIKFAHSENKKIIIETERTVGLKGKYRYHMIEKENTFKVDRKEMYDSFEKKWVNSTI